MRSTVSRVGDSEGSQGAPDSRKNRMREREGLLGGYQRGIEGRLLQTTRAETSRVQRPARGHRGP